MLSCEHCGSKMSYCPCCGESREAAEPVAPAVTIAIVSPTAGDRAKQVQAKAERYKRSMGDSEGDGLSFHDRVAKRIRRTVSGDE